jgi:NADH-quinone oxidoreductase subunit D
MRSRSVGPGHRASTSGVPYDVRKAHPYLVYDRMEFDVPVGTTGDKLRSLHVPAGRDSSVGAHHRASLADARRRPDQHRRSAHRLPPKSEVYSTIEGTIQHFKIVMEGIKVPAGECYSYTEAGNGELGFYLVSDGSGTPYRVRIRPPCFASTQGPRATHHGRDDPDVVPTFGSLNMIGGECDH